MRVTTNGVSLYYEVKGSGPPMILLHGNGEDHTIFDRAAHYLEQAFTLYLIDSRGHGQSSPVREFHYQDMADDLSEFIRKLKLDRPIVLGFSDGAIVGLMYASRHPDGLSHLFACGANTRPDTLKGFGMWRCRLGPMEKKDPKVRMMLTEPDITKEDLERIAVPVTVIAGSRDCIDRKDTEFIASSIPNAKLVIMKRCDHCSYIVHNTRIVDPVFVELGIDLSDIELSRPRRGGFRWNRGVFTYPPVRFKYSAPNRTSGIE